MDEEKKEDLPQRPNANYELSSRQTNQESSCENKIVFHYNRQRRLEKAPQLVKDMFAEKTEGNKFNFFRPLVADRPRRIIFAVIVLMCAGIYVFSALGRLGQGRAAVLDGNQIDVSAAMADDFTIVVLTKTANSEEAFTGSVYIAVIPLAIQDGEHPIFSQRIFFSYQTIEEYRFVVPFTAGEMLMMLQTENNSVNVRFSPR